MIKFFRKLRFSSLSRKRIPKYLLYATGEIVLVVIGILIALSINNWNEQRKNHTQERRYIGELRSDLQKDSIAIQDMIKISNGQLRSKGLLFMFLENHSDYKMPDEFKSSFQNLIYEEKTVSDSIVAHFRKQGFLSYSFASNKATFDEMTSTGNMGLISNRVLRRRILETYNDYELFKLNEESIFKKQQEEIWKLVYARVPSMYNLKSNDIPQIFEDPEFINRFEGNAAGGMNKGLMKLQISNQKLLDQLNEYQNEN
jgi:hypothetical protein